MVTVGVRRVHVLAWRDLDDPDAGGSEVHADEFMRRFLLHVLPAGLHRIRHYGLLANGSRKASLALVRKLLGQPSAAPIPTEGTDNGIARDRPCFVCAHCGPNSHPHIGGHARAKEGTDVDHRGSAREP